MTAIKMDSWYLVEAIYSRSGAPCLPVMFKDLKHKEPSHG